MVCKRPSSTSLACYQLCIRSTGTTLHLDTKSSEEQGHLVDVHVPYRNDSFKAPGRCSACAPGKGVPLFLPEIPETTLAECADFSLLHRHAEGPALRGKNSHAVLTAESLTSCRTWTWPERRADHFSFPGGISFTPL